MVVNHSHRFVNILLFVRHVSAHIKVVINLQTYVRDKYL